MSEEPKTEQDSTKPVETTGSPAITKSTPEPSTSPAPKPIPPEAIKLFKTAEECCTSIDFPELVQREDEKFWYEQMFTDYIKRDQQQSSSSSSSSSTNDQPQGSTDNEGADEDDMIFFVRKTIPGKKVSPKDQYFVRRRTAGNVPTWSNDKTVDWERSYLLNYITQVKTYVMTVMVCHNEDENPQKPFHTVKRVVKPVYGSPHKVNITDTNDKSATVQEVGFPYIYFTVIDFDDAFRDITIPGPGYFIAVRLTAQVQLFGVDLGQISLFSGGLTYSAFMKSYAEQGSWWWLGGTLGKKLPGLLAPVLPGKMRPSEQRFAEIRGPGGKGFVKFGLEPADEVTEEEEKKKEEKNKKVVALRCMPTYLSLSYDNIATTLFKKGSLKISQINNNSN